MPANRCTRLAERAQRLVYFCPRLWRKCQRCAIVVVAVRRFRILAVKTQIQLLFLVGTVIDIKTKFCIPVLRKDFTVDEYQIYEAKLYGADAILLIMAALTDAEYKKFHALADSIGLDVLVETHNEEEVKRAVEYGRIIGVNNRNLQTFDEDITTCERLLPLIPDGKVKVAESAIRKHSDFEYLRGLKFDAALIGEAFMREKDIKKAVDNLRYGN